MWKGVLQSKSYYKGNSVLCNYHPSIYGAWGCWDWLDKTGFSLCVKHTHQHSATGSISMWQSLASPFHELQEQPFKIFWHRGTTATFPLFPLLSSPSNHSTEHVLIFRNPLAVGNSTWTKFLLECMCCCNVQPCPHLSVTAGQWNSSQWGDGRWC